MQNVTQEIFRYKNLTFKIVVKSDYMGFSGGNSQNSENSYYDLRTSVFLVIGFYKYDKEDRSKTVRHDVYFSYPHMHALKVAFQALSTMYQTNPTKIFDEVDDPEHGYLLAVNQKYMEYGEKVRGAEKYVSMTFDTTENEMKNTMDKGVRIYIGMPEYNVFVPIDIFLSIDLMVQEFNLLTNSQNLTTAFMSNMASRRSSRKTSARRNVDEEEV
jgi:hypothetical protein